MTSWSGEAKINQIHKTKIGTINIENISPPKRSVCSCLLEGSLKGRWSHLLDMKVALNTRGNAKCIILLAMTLGLSFYIT